MLKKIGIGLIIFVAILGVFYMVTSQMSSTIVVERTFNTPVKKVWEMWNNPETIKNWWSPKGYTAPVVTNDLREGGKYLLAMKSPKGDLSYNVGTYKEIIPNKKIVSVMSFSDENGNVVPASTYGLPGKWPDEILMTVEFEQVGEQTKVKVREEGIPTIISIPAKMGWEQQFDKFQALL